VKSTCPNAGEDAWSASVQGQSSSASQRIAAIESRQDDLDGKISLVLASTKAHTKALDELNAMFAKYIGRFRDSEDGSPSVSKSTLENQVSHPSPLVESVELQDVDIPQHPQFEVDTQDSSAACNTREMVKVTSVAEKTAEKPAEKPQKQEKDKIIVPSAVENRERDQTSIPSVAAKSKVNPGASNAPATAVPTMPSKPQLKPLMKIGAVVRESGMPHSSPRKAKATPEKTGDLKPVDREVKGGSGPSKAKTMGTTTDDSNPYSLEGAIDGLLEVGGSGGHRSPAKVKKLAKPVEDEAPAIPKEEAPTKVRSKDLQVAHRAPTPARTKLLVFNVHGTLLDCSLLLDKNPNTAIWPMLRTAKRRVVFRPGLIDFLNKCFVHFEVAFWGEKNEVYMDDVVPSMLRRMKEGSTFRPLFV
jgi:hypothetical protein